MRSTHACFGLAICIVLVGVILPIDRARAQGVSADFQFETSAFMRQSAYRNVDSSAIEFCPRLSDIGGTRFWRIQPTKVTVKQGRLLYLSQLPYKKENLSLVERRAFRGQCLQARFGH